MAGCETFVIRAKAGDRCERCKRILEDGTPAVYFRHNLKFENYISRCQHCDPLGVEEKRRKEEEQQKHWKELRESWKARPSHHGE